MVPTVFSPPACRRADGRNAAGLRRGKSTCVYPATPAVPAVVRCEASLGGGKALPAAPAGVDLSSLGDDAFRKLREAVAAEEVRRKG
jgi:hypothetical protein